MDSLWQDLRFGLRMMLKSPGYSLIVIITLALGIGANSAIFSVANALLLNPLPFENIDQLVLIRETLPKQGLKATAVSPGDFFDWRRQATSFKNLTSYRVRDVTISGDPEAEIVRGSFVASGFFGILKVKMALGREFSPDVYDSGEPVAVIGYGLWQRRFAGDSNIIGRTISLNGREHTIAGILPGYFDYPFGTEVWIPLYLSADEMTQRTPRNLYVVGELVRGLTLQKAQAELKTIAATLARQYPETNAGLNVQVIPLREQLGDFTRPLLLILFGMAVFVLLIACVNVANLVFVRSTERRKEIAVRSALGAGRWRIIRQLIIESLLLTIVAGTAGIFIAIIASDLIRSSLPADVAQFMTGWKQIEVDSRVILFTAIITFLTTLFFSTIPAIRFSKPDLNATLKEGGRFHGRPALGRFRMLLVAFEIALALVLLSGSGLMVKGFWRTLNLFDSAEPERILAVQIPLNESKYEEASRAIDFFNRITEQLKVLPGIQSVSAASNTPLNNSPNLSVELTIEGRPAPLPGERQTSDLMVIGPSYFRTIGAKFIQGRDFYDGDNVHRPPVAIISEMTAKRYWSGQSAIGRRFKWNRSGSTAEWVTIVGVVSDLKQSWFDKEIRPQFYLPYSQSPRLKMYLLLRSSGDPLKIASSVREQVMAVDRDQPIEKLKTLLMLFQDEMSPFRFAAVLVFVFGAIALILSAVGVYSIMSYSVVQRTHEIGLRMAVGAQIEDVVNLIQRQGISTAALGLAGGLFLSLALGHFMASRLFGVVSLEYVVIGGFIAVLFLVAFLSVRIPALRAARIDPISALRYE